MTHPAAAAAAPARARSFPMMTNARLVALKVLILCFVLLWVAVWA